MKITGTLIKNYLHCKRQAYLYYYGLNFWNELVRLGEELHKNQNKEEFVFENIKIDDIKNQKIIEFKKSLSNKRGTEFQVLYYLKYFKDRGLNLKAQIIDLSRHEKEEISLTENKKEELNKLIEEIEKTLNGNVPKRKSKKKECKGCSFFYYCWIE